MNSDKVDVTVDLNAPVITRPFLAAGKPYALLNVASDLAPASTGAQTQLAYTATVPTGKDNQTYLRAVLLTADHTAYHVGQLVAVRRALGIWPGGS